MVTWPSYVDELGTKRIMTRLPRVTVPAVFLALVSSGCGGGSSNPPPEEASICGDGELDEGEVCDGEELGGETCLTLGRGEGVLACSADCKSFDETSCGECGDGTCAPGECETCPGDCASCGDGCCTASEDAASCPDDCFVPGVLFGTIDTMTYQNLDVYAADLDGEFARKLSANPRYEHVAGSLDWTHVAYTSFSTPNALYVVPTVVGDAIPVFEPKDDTTVGPPIWAPDGSRIAFPTVDSISLVLSLHTSPPSEGETVPVAERLSSLGFYEWFPDGSRIAYHGEDGWLHAVRPDGTDDVSIWQAAVDQKSAGDFFLAPDGSSIAWVAPDRSLHTVGTDGSGHAVCGQGVAGPPSWAPDSSHVAYSADQDTAGGFGIYTCVPGEPDSLLVSEPLTPEAGYLPVPFWAPDSSRIAYVADQDTDGVREVFTVLPDGTSNLKASGPLVAGGGVIGLAWSPDSSRIAYTADQDTDEVFELYTSPPDGTDNLKASGSLVAGGDVVLFFGPVLMSWFGWAPDGSRIAYTADQDTDEVFELYTSLPNGDGNVKVSAPLTPGRNVFRSVQWSSDSARIVYATQDPTRSATLELLSALPDGSGSAVIWTPPPDVSFWFVAR